MGNADTKLNFRKAVIQLTSKSLPLESTNDSFWDQFWNENIANVQDVFTLIPATEIRALREEAPSNLATLVYKAVEKLVNAADRGCATQQEQVQVLNCVRILTRVIPYIFEDKEWRGFFWSNLPVRDDNSEIAEEAIPLAHSIIFALCDLLFCPDFTVSPNKKNGPDKHEDLQSIDSCEYIWESGVGFANSPPQVQQHCANRTEILKLILTCFSQVIYQNASESSANKWIEVFTSPENRHALPLFTSLLNIVCAFKPSGFGVPYNHLLFTNNLEPLVEVCIQILIGSLDHESSVEDHENIIPDNLFVNYLIRIHREDDFAFILKGFTSLLSNPLQQTYLPHSSRKVQFHQELLVFFWKFCDFNKKFLFYVLKSSEVLQILVPILYHLNDARADQSRVGLMHIGVFILLLLSGERNFGVRLNKPYTAAVPMDIPVFTGTHADLLIIVFHKIITTGHHRLQPLFDCLLTILVNVSPYIKTMSMVAATKLLHLLEAFSTPWFLFSAPRNHHLIFFLLETFNNIIQYQFDGNSNLIYTIIRKRQVFHSLANLPTDSKTIIKSFNRKVKLSVSNEKSQSMMEGSRPAQPAEPGTKTTTLPDVPRIDKMTERESAHPTSEQLQKLTQAEGDVQLEETETNSISQSEGSGIQPQREVHEIPSESIKSRKASESSAAWQPSTSWVSSWKAKLPLQTIMRLLQVLVPQVEKICIDKGLTDESEILRFLQHGTLVGLLPVPHPILIRKYQANVGTAAWFRTYMWGVIYLRNTDPPIWYDTDVRLFEIQRV